MKYLFGTIVIIMVAFSFIGPKCDHVFTQIESPIVKVKQSDAWVNAVYTMPPTGIHEGKYLICVKCFMKQKQMVDYGQPHREQTLSGLFLGIDSSLFLNGGNLVFDTVGLIHK